MEIPGDELDLLETVGTPPPPPASAVQSNVSCSTNPQSSADKSQDLGKCANLDQKPEALNSVEEGQRVRSLFSFWGGIFWGWVYEFTKPKGRQPF